MKQPVTSSVSFKGSVSVCVYTRERERRFKNRPFFELIYVDLYFFSVSRRAGNANKLPPRNFLI